VPVIGKRKAELINSENTLTAILTSWNVPLLLIAAGILVLLVKLLIQLFSFYKMRKKAVALAINGMNIYQVDDNIIPFSFGNSIFINRKLHNDIELQEIIRHEFIHVKQKHSLDIIWGELLCLLNWYNPFAWMLKRSIRQNLEFIADNKVIESGIDKKEYQYLLLKVTGNNQYSIATQFNFSSLKKRIAMMNKLKSTKRQLLRMLFLLPATAILLLAFRNIRDAAGEESKAELKTITTEQSSEINKHVYVSAKDTVPEVTKPNNKGYIINIKDKKGECEIVIKDKNKNEVKRLLLTEWNKEEEKYKALYGEIPPPPPPIPSKAYPIKSATPDVKSYTIENNIATATLKSGKKEIYNLDILPEKEAYEKKYGVVEIPVVQVKEVRIETSQTIPVKVSAETVTEVRLTEIPVTINSNTNAAEVKTIKASSNVNTTTKIASVSTSSTVSNVEYPAKVSKAYKESPVTVVGYQTNKNSSLDPVTVTGYPIDASAAYKESPLMLNLGGLSIQNVGQYILVDGKEPGPEYKGTLKGTYRITFLDKDDAVKKYGDKGKKGAVILETIKQD
jgi:hypothetical protein